MPSIRHNLDGPEIVMYCYAITLSMSVDTFVQLLAYIFIELCKGPSWREPPVTDPQDSEIPLYLATI